MAKSSGFTLLEVLISLFIFAILLLSFDAIEMTTLHNAKSSYYFSIATQQMQVLKEQLTMLGGTSNDTLIIHWQKQIQSMLPQGQSSIEGTYPHYQIAITWGSMPLSNCQQKNQIKMDQNGCLTAVFNLA